MDEERCNRNCPRAFDSQGKARSTSRESGGDDSFSALDPSSKLDGTAVAEDKGKADEASTDSSLLFCWKCGAPFQCFDSLCEHVSMHLTDEKEIEECTATLEAMAVCYGDEFEHAGMLVELWNGNAKIPAKPVMSRVLL
ncbi:hypothetical protein HPB50_017487 [Hyalomma asiaticum]|uniref:Uncharacterized protein n=1 Tax=Hyalomma asiaticum TaxID=266040 RepID=A0ACB7T5V4_HYAAI|nr:hypothetical protein HPB50_017487 [Hyalomma asiaticum]